MSWFQKEERSFFEKIVIRVLKTGKVPRHVAFIMDGNRRFAKQKQLDSVVTGHVQGFDKLTHVSVSSLPSEDDNDCFFLLNNRYLDGVMTWALRKLLFMPSV